jgi:acetoacetate decarboxylase
MPDSTGFGSYQVRKNIIFILFWYLMLNHSLSFLPFQEAGTVIPCTFEGKEVNFTTQMFLDCEPPIAGGREIWGT